MLIQEISKGGPKSTPEEIIALAVAEFTKACPLAPWLEFFSIPGNAHKSRKKDGTITAGTQRALGSDYGSAKSNTPTWADIALKIYGDMVKTDIGNDRRGIDIGSQRAKDLKNMAASLGRFFMDSLFNDTVDATHFSGLIEQITALSRKVVFDTVNGGTVPMGHTEADLKQRDKFIEYLNAASEDIDDGASVMVMNSDMIARLETIGRKYLSTQNVKDIFGIDQTVQTYRNVPIINSRYKANGTGLVIPNDETEGTSADCTSIYLLKFGEEMDVSLATNIGLDVRDLGGVGAQLETLIEIDVDLAILNSKAVKRISGIRLAA